MSSSSINRNGKSEIKIDKLSKVYPGNICALDHIDLDIGGGMFGLIGPNGAGKTSLMRILAGLIRPTSGNAEVFGHTLNSARGRQSVKGLLGYLPQELGLYPNLTGREFLDYIAILKGIVDPANRKRQIVELLETVRLTEAADRKLKGYSGGMKRRIGIAQALLGQPKLLIVDEPTSGLDPEERVRLRTVLAEMAKRCTVILSTHIIEDISQSCNDLALMNKGTIIFRGSPAALIAQASGQVWHITTQDETIDSNLSIVSMVQLETGTRYRVVGTPEAHYQATPIEPSLEDGYIYVLQRTRAVTA
jgi:ABC-type multidrug transport system ATPase subunit